jgi:polyphosphate kinase 2 (PPK2 family)
VANKSKPKSIRKKPKKEEYEFKVYPKGSISLEDVDLSKKLADDDYEQKLPALQRRMFELGVEIFQKKRRAIFVFEGRDAAGKGGVIRRMTTQLDPRGYKVWPIAAPKDGEQRHHYLWRFWNRLPEEGEIGIFDRSWYGRVLVERVEKLARPEEWQRAYDEINAFERMLTDDGVLIAKFFLHIDKKEQLRRFKDREKDPFKQYKLGPDDWRNRANWSGYDKAIHEMFDKTHRPDARWHLIPANDKKYARIHVIERCIELLEEICA